MLGINHRKVQQLSPLGIWLFILGRVIAAFGLGVIVVTYWPSLGFLGWPAVVVGMVLLLAAFKGYAKAQG